MYNKMSKSAIEQAQDQESIEVEAILELYPSLQQYCRFLSQNKWDGDDIAQEAMIKAVQHYKNYTSISSSLLKKIAHNHWIDTIRKRKRETLEENPYIEGGIHAAESSEIMETIEILLQRLTPKQAVIYSMKEAFLFQSNEIAEILGTTEMAVKSTLHRAKNRLEKSKQNEDSFLVKEFWNDEEYQLLSELLYHSLLTQDPEVLIQAIPSIHSVNCSANVQKLRKFTLPINKKISPSNTLCMAA